MLRRAQLRSVVSRRGKEKTTVGKSLEKAARDPAVRRRRIDAVAARNRYRIQYRALDKSTIESDTVEKECRKKR